MPVQIRTSLPALASRTGSVRRPSCADHTGSRRAPWSLPRRSSALLSGNNRRTARRRAPARSARRLPSARYGTSDPSQTRAGRYSAAGHNRPLPGCSRPARRARRAGYRSGPAPTGQHPSGRRPTRPLRPPHPSSLSRQSSTTSGTGSAHPARWHCQHKMTGIRARWRPAGRKDGKTA